MSDNIVIEIPQHIKDKLQAIANKPHSNGRRWAAWEDKIIADYWDNPDYLHKDIAEILGISTNTALKRYRELRR